MLMKDCVEENLKPCPFCGGEAERDYVKLEWGCAGVHCKNCGVYVFDYDSYGWTYDSEIAVKKWNKRTNEETLYGNNN